MNESAKIVAYIKQHRQWSGILNALRAILLATELEETVKWGMPTYTLEGKNVLSMAGFKQHCALWFHQGALLTDKKKKLINAQEGTTKAQRQWRFASGEKLDVTLLKSYIREAIENQKVGKKIAPVKKALKELKVPEELEAALKNNKKLQQAFSKLTPGKQREYAEHVATAKQEKTRLARILKITPMIVAGAGLNDKYRNC